MLYVVGPALNVRGGVTPVECELLEYAHRKGYLTRHFATSVNGNYLNKISALVTSLLRFMFFILKDKTEHVIIGHLMTVGYNSFRRKILFCLILSFFNIKYIVHLHSYNFFFYYENISPLENVVLRYFLDRATLILVVSKEIKDKLSGMGFLKTRILYNPVTVGNVKQNIKPIKEGIELLVLARYAKEKNIAFLIECVDRIREMKMPMPFLKVYGYGDRRYYNDIVQKKGLRDYVLLADWIEGLEKERAMREADVFVLASDYEGLPVFLLEGLALGKPILASDVPGCRETVVDGYNGFLFKCMDVEDFCAKYKNLLRDRKIVEYGKMSKKIYREKYTKEIFIKNLDSVYNAMLL